MATASIKSAERVLKVLEHFAGSHVPASVADICNALGYPQSSTSVLLKSMETLGYLAYDSATRRYRPTVRVLLLGAWLHDELFGEGSIISLMASIRRRRQQSVMIGLRQGLNVRYVLSLRSPTPLSMFNPTGTLRPICVSAIGKVLLALEDDADLPRIAASANKQVADPAHRVDVPAFVKEVRAARRNGWAACHDYPLPGIGGIAVRLPGMAGHPPMAIALGVSMHRLRTERDDLVAELNAACDRLFTQHP